METATPHHRPSAAPAGERCAYHFGTFKSQFIGLNPITRCRRGPRLPRRRRRSRPRTHSAPPPRLYPPRYCSYPLTPFSPQPHSPPGKPQRAVAAAVATAFLAAKLLPRAPPHTPQSPPPPTPSPPPSNTPPIILFCRRHRRACRPHRRRIHVHRRHAATTAPATVAASPYLYPTPPNHTITYAATCGLPS